jgi:hypothetical protein
VDTRARLVGLLLVVLLLAVVAFVMTRGSDRLVDVPAPRDPILPDLVTLPLTDVLVGTSEVTGEEALRFTATIANVGEGSLRVDGYRSDGSSDDWQVVQAFDEPDGEPSGVDTGANLVFGGHGHDHWHLKFGAVYTLTSADGSQEVASTTKAGYCFFDQIRLETAPEDAPTQATFASQSCGTPDSRQVGMGLSPGWSDPYFWQLEDQSVDVTGLPDGRYRLTADADPDGWLQESDETNNATWLDLELTTAATGRRTVEVIGTAGDG